MVRLTELDDGLATFLRERVSPAIPGSPWTVPAPPGRRRVALVSSAGLRLSGDRAFGTGAADYRVIPAERAGDVVMDHVSVSHDRTAFQDDVNTVFPLQRLGELAEAGTIGSLADYHYSFMGATDPVEMEDEARGLAGLMKADGVNTVILAPV